MSIPGGPPSLRPVGPGLPVSPPPPVAPARMEVAQAPLPAVEVGPQGEALRGEAVDHGGALDAVLAEGDFELEPLPAVETLPALGPGATGPEVVRVQAALQIVGMHEGPLTGVMDEATVAEVQGYQQRFGLEADGVVGPATWAQLQDHEAMQDEGARLRAEQAAADWRPPTGIGPGPGTSAAPSPEDTPWVAPRVTNVHRVHAEDQALPVVPTPESSAYAELLALDHAPNPMDYDATMAVVAEARDYEEGLLTQSFALEVEDGRHLTVRMEAGMNPDEILPVVAQLYAASHPDHRLAVDTVELHAGPSAYDEATEIRLREAGVPMTGDDGKAAMNASHGTIRFFNVGDPGYPMRQDLWDHEMGHAMMEHHPLTSEVPMVPQGWVEAMALDDLTGHGGLPTPYAGANDKEDFAEAYRFYLGAMRKGDLESYRERYPNRSLILDRLMAE